MEEWTLNLIIAAISFVIFIVLAAYVFLGTLRDSVIFRPTRGYLNRPDGEYRDVYVGDVMTRWVENGSEDVLFYLHGNSGNIDHRSYAVEFAELLGVDLVLMDYRGYGKSKGTPTIENMRQDSDLVMDVILDKYRKENVIVMSESLGSIVSSYLASRYKVRGVIILAGISSFTTLSKNTSVSPIMQKLAAFTLGTADKKSNASLLAKAVTPVLVVHSKTDEVVPFECALENVSVCPTARDLVIIRGGHSTPKISREALSTILEFAGLGSEDVERYDEWRKDMEVIGLSPDFRIVDK